MIKFRSRLLFALISLIAAVLICSAILLGELFKSYYLKSFDKGLENEGNLIAVIIEEKGGIYSFPKENIRVISNKLDFRVSIVDLHGRILLDSENHADSVNSGHSKIIKEAIEKYPNESSRMEIGKGLNLHYYGTPILKNKVVEGYVFLSSKVGEIDKANHEIWWLLSISTGITLIIIIFLGVKITNRYTKPIEAATNVAIELSKGNYRARTYEDPNNEANMLSSAINILARNFQEVVKKQEMQQDRLSTLIENMGSGLILIDNRGYISLINKAYKELFTVDTNQFLFKLYYDVLKHKEITELIEEIFMTEQKIVKQLLLPLSIERRYFQVFGSPIIGTYNEWKGVLLVFHDITEIKKLEQMRKDFVANVSHELNTPITSIKGFSETLLDGAMKDQATLEQFLSIILKESDRLQALIQDLLDLSKIEQQGFRLNIEEIDIMQLLKEVKTMLHNKADHKEISLQVIEKDSRVFINGDYYRLKQVFINLFNNAINYTSPGGKVEIEVKDEETKVCVQIKDTGIGIEKEEIPRIFERFYRIDKARGRNSGGTGLGLAIVKHIIEAHKGQIFVESEIDKGSTFTICLEKFSRPLHKK
ncbi:two-component system histidine kinase PnpS [Bacillus sp. CGMCC 1.16607]|uniref:two-component system histidine kinase PnpS n=1 Tax=Bacillus sp. CGMCC 1.16607 TaxID=3351842 RepID=UPI00363A44CE